MAKKVYEEANIKAIADKIREKSDSNSTYKTSEMPSGIDEVYEAGRNSMIDESKIIEATATGKGSITLNDVSEVPHKITAKLSSVVGEISSLYTANAINTELEFPQKYGICPILSVDKENRIIHSFYVSSDEWNVPTDIYVTDDFDLELLDGAIGVYCYAEWYPYDDFVINGYAFQIIYPITLSVTDGNGNSQIYTPTANAFFNNELWASDCIGIIENIGSASPNMIFSADKEEVEITVDYHKSWGMQAEWNRFWDAYQHNGERTHYAYAFAGIGWDKDNLLPPKYPISVASGTYAARGMFQQFKVDASVGDRYDFTEMSKLIDASQITYANEMFADAQVENVTLDLSKCRVATSMFNIANAGGDVDKLYLKVTEALNVTVSMFAYCTNLKTFRFIEGSVLATSISFANSSKLSDESVDSIINALKDLTGATSKTLTVHAKVYDRMVERGVDALVTAKNWALAKA
jgi:hypothetical protein